MNEWDDWVECRKRQCLYNQCRLYERILTSANVPISYQDKLQSKKPIC